MKHTLMAVILALSVASWAQNTTPAPPADQQQSTAKCACCDKMASADSKDTKMCARHGKNAKAGKDGCCDGTGTMACCGKDSKSCMKGDKTAASCCKDCGKDKTASSCCGQACKAGCCGKSTQAAMNCCRHARQS